MSAAPLENPEVTDRVLRMRSGGSFCGTLVALRPHRLPGS